MRGSPLHTHQRRGDTEEVIEALPAYSVEVERTDPDIEAQQASARRVNRPAPPLREVPPARREDDPVEDRLFSLVDRLVVMSDKRSGEVVAEVRGMSAGLSALTSRMTWMMVILALGGLSSVVLVVVAFLGLTGSISLPGGVHIETSRTVETSYERTPEEAHVPVAGPEEPPS